MGTTTKGIFLKSMVDAVRKEKGPEGLKELEEIFGDIHFAGFKDYPGEVDKRLNKAVIKVIYGEETPEAWREFGKLGFRTYADSIIGKTMFSLLGNDLRRIALAVERVFNTVTSGYQISVEEVSESEIRIRIKNTHENREYLKGLFVAAVEHFGEKGKVTSRVFGEEDYEYSVKWG